MDYVWRLIHLVAAAYWLGGLITLAVVAVVARRSVDDATFRPLMARVGRAFLLGSLIAGAAIAVSGVAMAATHLHSLADVRSTEWGRTLETKTSLAILLVAVAGLHSFAGSRPSRRWIVASRVLSPAMVVVTLVVFFLAIRLTELG